MSDSAQELAKGCPRCGVGGIHACLGVPLLPLSEDEQQRLKAALAQVVEHRDYVTERGQRVDYRSGAAQRLALQERIVRWCAERNITEANQVVLNEAWASQAAYLVADLLDDVLNIEVAP